MLANISSLANNIIFIGISSDVNSMLSSLIDLIKPDIIVNLSFLNLSISSSPSIIMRTFISP